MPKLIPVADALSKPFWDAVNQRRLVLQRCTACDRLQYPPQQACQQCGSAAGLTWQEVVREWDGRVSEEAIGEAIAIAGLVVKHEPFRGFHVGAGRKPARVPAAVAA